MSALLWGLASSSSAASQDIKRPQVTRNTPLDTNNKELKTSMQTLIDIRELDEVNQGMIQGASWIALSEIQQNSQRAQKFFEKLKQSGVQTVHLYCRSGNRVNMITPFFEGQGYQVVNLKGFQNLVAEGQQSFLPNMTTSDQSCTEHCL